MSLFKPDGRGLQLLTRAFGLSVWRWCAVVTSQTDGHFKFVVFTFLFGKLGCQDRNIRCDTLAFAARILSSPEEAKGLVWALNYVRVHVQSANAFQCT